MIARHGLLLLTFAMAASLASAATIEDFTQWTLIEDPAHPNFSASVDSPTQVTLSSVDDVPNATDIGFASVNGQDVATSSAGFAFDPSAPFSVAVDFDFSAVSSVGGSGIGFGIGEDIDGTDSAGIALAAVNGQPLAFSGASRVNDIDQGLELINVVAFARGRFFVDYTPAGAITVGVNATPGAAAPSVTAALEGLQAQWDGEMLLASFFLRSQAASPIPGITSGAIDAVFSNFEVLSGAAISIPEPSAVALAWVAGVALRTRRQARG